MSANRRQFLTQASGFLFASSISSFCGRRASANAPGSLLRDPAGILDLPPGFAYKVIDRSGNLMSDGYKVPALPDGMACFQSEGSRLILVRNHEVEIDHAEKGPYLPHHRISKHAFDPSAFGGVTRLVIDMDKLEVVSKNLVLTGTDRNCNGGSSPWGWISCEESDVDGHGYAFLCDPYADKVQKPQQIKGYGRFRKEGAAIDPRTGYAYLTEDEPDSCLYRFKAKSPERPFEGHLQAMKVVGIKNFKTSSKMHLNETYEIKWVDIDDPDPKHGSVRKQAHEKGAAIISRGEGIWFHDDRVFFVATDGGAAKAGQIFQIEPRPGNGKDQFKLLYESPDKSILDMPDSLTLSPLGDCFVAEDGEHGNMIRVLKPDGTLLDFANNALSKSEFAGLCFDPTGEVLFLNLMDEGLTLAVVGPFDAFGNS